MNTAKVDGILESYGHGASHIIAILQDVQAAYKYLPRRMLEYVAEKVDMPVNQIYHLATFFAAFSLEPRGKHLIHVCMGTACHVRGAPRILSGLERKLKVAEGGTTADKKFTLERVNCVGSCALGPLVTIDDKYYGRVTTTKMDKIVDSYSPDEVGAAKAKPKPKAKAKAKAGSKEKKAKTGQARKRQPKKSKA